MSVRILVGDCRELLRQLPEASAHTCVTGGPRGCVEIDGVERVTATQAIEMAEQKGWVG